MVVRYYKGHLLNFPRNQSKDPTENPGPTLAYISTEKERGKPLFVPISAALGEFRSSVKVIHGAWRENSGCEWACLAQRQRNLQTTFQSPYSMILK